MTETTKNVEKIECQRVFLTETGQNTCSFKTDEGVKQYSVDLMDISGDVEMHQSFGTNTLEINPETTVTCDLERKGSNTIANCE